MNLNAGIGTVTRVNRRGNWLVGCGVALAVLLLIVIGVGVFVAMNWRTWTANGMDAGIRAMLVEAPIDDAERAETQAVVDDFIARFRDGDITIQQLGQVTSEIMASPVLPAGMAIGISKAYFEESALTPEEKAEGSVQVSRVAHGLADESLDPSVLRTVLAPLRADPGATDVIQFDLEGQPMRIKAPKDATEDELRAFIQQARTVADENSLPPVPPPFDLSGELDGAIKRALGEAEGPAVEPGVIDVPADGPADAPDEP
jgi:hypothetical protein